MDKVRPGMDKEKISDVGTYSRWTVPFMAGGRLPGARELPFHNPGMNLLVPFRRELLEIRV